MNVYRAPQGDVKNCCTLLTKAFDDAQFKGNTEFYILGDFNVNYRDSKSTAYKELDFTMKSLGLVQLIDEPTRPSHRLGTDTSSTLDLIFTNSMIICEAGTLDINLSDHLAIWATRKKKFTKKDKINFRGRSYKNYMKEDFQQSLSEHNWNAFFQMGDPNDLRQYLYKTILKYIDPMCPTKSFKVFSAREPWITNEALELIKDKDRLLKKAKRSKKPEDWEQARLSRNSVGRRLTLLKSEFLKDQQIIHKSDPKKFWKTIATIIPNNKSATSGIWLKDEPTSQHVDPNQVPNNMNEYFTQVGPKLAQRHNSRWKYFGVELEDSIEGISTNVDEVIELCKGIETMKSSGFDKLSSRICKDAFLVLIDQLVHLFNCSLKTGVFPKAWKSAKVIPLFKGGDREHRGNYRAVSLLPLPGKLLEKIVHDRMVDFFNDNKFLIAVQGGFQKRLLNSFHYCKLN